MQSIQSSECGAAHADEPCHWTPCEPARKFTCEDTRAIHDYFPGSEGGVLIDVSHPHAMKERQIGADDQVRVEAGRLQAHGNFAWFEHQPQAPSIVPGEVEFHG